MTTSSLRPTAELITGLLIDKFEVDPAGLSDDALMTDLLVDSLMVVEMAISLKDDLGVTVTEAELRELGLAEFTARVDARRTR
ncbi:acyl carrier protein [Streptomyces sp. VRA16 Mangrove soil]|uniref:acyl carrier protein n=1 Tax=Streptomyces sp. VRA16 Mangrove soil TaxID=2817434 RepID=UPI001A9DB5E3|nr:acyl carrier protein [Streptomyces sp. VRA16 Mangrove soil]MBO1331442.1 hypothetical protein [Streptomyces sp. VRA16 Mangrove soil]